jgi:hypothetical protein
VTARGEVAVAAALGLSRQTLARAVAGFDLHLGNIVLIRRWLAGEGS